HRVHEALDPLVGWIGGGWTRDTCDSPAAMLQKMIGGARGGVGVVHHDLRCVDARKETVEYDQRRPFPNCPHVHCGSALRRYQEEAVHAVIDKTLEVRALPLKVLGRIANQKRETGREGCILDRVRQLGKEG